MEKGARDGRPDECIPDHNTKLKLRQANGAQGSAPSHIALDRSQFGPATSLLALQPRVWAYNAILEIKECTQAALLLSDRCSY